MLAYIARRFGSLLLTLLFVTMVLFVLMHSVPGGPFEVKFEKQPLPDFALENIKHKYGLGVYALDLTGDGDRRCTARARPDNPRRRPRGRDRDGGRR